MMTKRIVVALLSVLLPACARAEEFSVMLDESGLTFVDGKALERPAWLEALKTAALNASKDGISSLKLTISCDNATPWSAFRTCCTEAAAQGVWDLTLSIGRKSAPCPLPRDRGLGTAPPDDIAVVRVYLARVAGAGTELLIDCGIRGKVAGEDAGGVAKAVAEDVSQYKQQGTACAVTFAADREVPMNEVLATLLALRSGSLPEVLFAVPASAPGEAGKTRAGRLRYIEELVCSGSELYHASTEQERSDAQNLLQGEKERFCREFAPANGALVACDVKRHVLLLAGGEGTRDGVTMVLSGKYLYGEFFLRGGDGGARGRAGRIATFANDRLHSESLPNAAGTDGERGGAMAWGAGGATASYQSGENGPEAEAGDATDFPEEESVRKIANAVEALELEWPDAENDAAREKLVAKHLLALRPSRGVVAAWSNSRRVVAVLGANGTERNVDGLTVEIFGKPAEIVIAIAGNAGPGGKPGKAVAGKGAITFDGK